MRKITIVCLFACALLSSIGMAAVPPGAGAADQAKLVSAQSAFALDLYARLRGRSGNLFFSPYSISTALGMTSAGARGETAVEMARVLHLPGPAEHPLHEAAGLLARGLSGKGRPCQLDVANALWGAREIPFQDGTQRLLQTHYGGPIRAADFHGYPEQSRQAINQWVEERTHRMIQGLLNPGDVTKDTTLVLVNAIYFKGDWQSVFRPLLTEKEAPFRLSESRTAPVAMMRQIGRFRYLDGGTFQALELPYAGGELALVVLLPREVGGLARLEESLTADRLEGWLSRATPSLVAVGLPKFELSWRLDLVRDLSEMGMRLPFTYTADFSGITRREKVLLEKVIHAARLRVDEKGTEAAAATAVAGGIMAAPPKEPPEELVVFRADHPFLFLLRDAASGSILFLGRLIEPAAQM